MEKKPFSSYTDEELVSVIQNQTKDSEFARNVLFARYSLYIRTIASCYYSNCRYAGISFDELHAEGMLSVDIAINKYNQQKSGKFYSFWVVIASREMMQYINSEKNKSILARFDCIELDKEIPYDEGERTFSEVISEPSQTEIKKSLYDIYLEAFLNNLTRFKEREIKVMNLILKGHDVCQIAELISRSQSNVYAIIKSIRTKMKDILGE